MHDDRGCGSDLQLCIIAGEAKPVEIELDTATAWSPTSPIAAAGVRRPTDHRQTGFVYGASAAGQTGLIEPPWPTVANGTVTDGSITWTATVPPAAGQDTVSSADWSQVDPPDATLTISGQATTWGSASALIGGGTAGQSYTVKVSITTEAGVIKVREVLVEVV